MAPARRQRVQRPTRGKTHIVRRYESLSEFVDMIEPESTTGGSYLSSRAGAGAYGGFYGNTSWEDALGFARHGWNEHHNELEGMLTGLVTKVENMVANQWEPVLSIEGGAVDVDRYLSGEPENMVQWITTKSSSSNQVVKVLVSTGALAAVDQGLIRMRGLAVCCLIELIGRTGKAVELWAESTAVGGNYTHTTLVKVKSAGSYLDLDQIMFAMMHPSWHRRMVFSQREHESSAVRQSFGYGGSIDPLMAGEVDASVVLNTIEPYDEDFKSVKTAVRWIERELKRLGLTKEMG